MSERSADDARADGDLYVITLCTASLPMVLRVPFVHELVGFSVFRSRTVEDGRERFRLYVAQRPAEQQQGEDGTDQRLPACACHAQDWFRSRSR